MYMNFVVTVYSAFLFFLLTPGILVNLPGKKYGKIGVALTHAVIFAIVFHFTHMFVLSLSEGFETTRVLTRREQKSQDRNERAEIARQAKLLKDRQEQEARRVEQEQKKIAENKKKAQKRNQAYEERNKSIYDTGMRGWWPF